MYRLILSAAVSLLFLVATASTLPQPVEREHFVYYFDNASYIDLADSVLNESAEKLAELLNDSLDYKPSVYLLVDLSEFKEVVRGSFPDWGAAAAVPLYKLIAIKSPDKFNLGKPLETLLKHEYSHLALAHRLGIRQAPRWFNEGLAMYTSEEWGWANNVSMSTAAVFSQFVPLSEIENMNRFSQDKAQVAYAESYQAVDYMLREYHRFGFTLFLDSLASGALIDNALEGSIGATYAEFEREFETYLEKRFNIVALFVNTMYLWVALAIVVVIGAFLKYKKRRSYYKKWEEDEKYHSTDFDYGDPDNPEQIDDDEPWRQ